MLDAVSVVAVVVALFIRPASVCIFGVEPMVFIVFSFGVHTLLVVVRSLP